MSNEKKWRVSDRWSQCSNKKNCSRWCAASPLFYCRSNIVWTSSSTSGRPTRMIHVFCFFQGIVRFLSFDFLIRLARTLALNYWRSRSFSLLFFFSPSVVLYSLPNVSKDTRCIAQTSRSHLKGETRTHYSLMNSREKTLSRCAGRLVKRSNASV